MRPRTRQYYTVLPLNCSRVLDCGQPNVRVSIHLRGKSLRTKIYTQNVRRTHVVTAKEATYSRIGLG